MNNPRTDTETLISALRILARDIESQDGVANAAIAEAADRLEEYHGTLRRICTGATIDSSDDYFPYYGKDGLKLIAKEARTVLGIGEERGER